MRISDTVRQAMTDAYLAGESASKVAVRFGVSWLTVLNSVRRLGCAVRTLSEAHSRPVVGLVDDYVAGMTYSELTRKYSVSPATLAKIINRAGVARRNPHLSDAEKEAIAQAYLSGLSRSAILSQCNVSTGTLSAILRARGIVKQRRNVRVCMKCGAERPKLSSNGKRTKCKPCSAAYSAAWRAANPERAAVASRKSQAKRRGDSTRWYRANVEAGREYVARRYARRKGAAGSHTAAEWATVKESQRGRCFDCGVIKPLTRGHLVPLSKGGSDYISNIVGQCRTCNSKQHARIHPSVLK